LKIPLNKGGKKAKPSGDCLDGWESGTDNPLAQRAAPFVKGEYFHRMWRRLGGMKNFFEGNSSLDSRPGLPFAEATF
jgi:hypothetical protein